MSFIIVTVTDPKNTFRYDFEVPQDLPAEKLLSDLTETINGLDPLLLLRQAGASLICRRLNKTVLPYQTLEEACVRNGDYLIFTEKEGGSP